MNHNGAGLDEKIGSASSDMRHKGPGIVFLGGPMVGSRWHDSSLPFTSEVSSLARLKIVMELRPTLIEAATGDMVRIYASTQSA